MKSKTRANFGLLIQASLGMAILTIIGVLVFSLTADERTNLATSATTYAVGNETLTTVTETGETIINNNQCGFSSFAVTVITNATGGGVIPATNYTYTAAGVIRAVGPTFNNSNWNASYTYKHAGISCNATVQADAAQFKLFSNLDLVALALVFGVIIFIILKVLPVNIGGF